jgi:hypothetical protein
MRARRTGALQESGDSFTDVRWQWKAFNTIAFAAHDDLAGAPINIFNRELGNFAGPQAQTH